MVFNPAQLHTDLTLSACVHCRHLYFQLLLLLMQLRGGRWWVDKSNDWAHSRKEAHIHHSAPDMTLNALRDDIATGGKFHSR
jgi:hypothetical protein